MSSYRNLTIKIKAKQNDREFMECVRIAQEINGDMTKDNSDAWHLTLYKLEFADKSQYEAITKELKKRLT